MVQAFRKDRAVHILPDGQVFLEFLAFQAVLACRSQLKTKTRIAKLYFLFYYTYNALQQKNKQSYDVQSHAGSSSTRTQQGEGPFSSYYASVTVFVTSTFELFTSGSIGHRAVKMSFQKPRFFAALIIMPRSCHRV